MTDVSLGLAFLAGLISFLSPCVLPLVPGYISMLSGIGVEQLRQGEQPKSGLFSSALSFVVGFSVVFIGFGASASAVGGFLRENRELLAPVAGALIILFGLHLIGGVDAHEHSCRVDSWSGAGRARHRLSLKARSAVCRTWRQPLLFSFHHWILRAATRPLAQSRRPSPQYQDTKPGIFSGFLLGFAFAFGWTPCIGPILATVLTLAAASDTVARGMLLLAVYSAGLAVPFLLTAVLLGQFLRFYKNFRKYLHAVELFSGVLLLFVGGLVFFNKLAWLSGKLSFLNRFSM